MSNLRSDEPAPWEFHDADIIYAEELEFEPDAVQLIAQEAIKRKTGARALRSIVEEIMLDIMYDIPSSNNIEKVISIVIVARDSAIGKDFATVNASILNLLEKIKTKN